MQQRFLYVENLPKDGRVALLAVTCSCDGRRWSALRRLRRQALKLSVGRTAWLLHITWRDQPPLLTQDENPCPYELVDELHRSIQLFFHSYVLVIITLWFFITCQFYFVRLFSVNLRIVSSSSILSCSYSKHGTLEHTFLYFYFLISILSWVLSYHGTLQTAFAFPIPIPIPILSWNMHGACKSHFAYYFIILDVYLVFLSCFFPCMS